MYETLRNTKLMYTGEKFLNKLNSADFIMVLKWKITGVKSLWHLQQSFKL